MFCFLPITTIALGRLTHEEVANASGLYNLMRNLGGAIGIAVVNTVLEARYDLHYLRIAETVKAGSVAVTETVTRLSPQLQTQLYDVERSERAALGMIRGLIQREASVMSYNDIFILIGSVFVLALLLMPLVRKVDHEADPAADGH